MRIMGGMGAREDAHWGQCFEEFYGPEYCKNLKKDLEKLKDEFYDGNAQRFQREWVVPTANLLRRMRHMGFPVRTRDFIVIHLYNPVDSMFAGEMHFQVGRKAPGTLTLKFTKQSTNGTFVIQPKTLSNSDEMKLNEEPMDFFDQVRHEMRDMSIDMPNLLRTLVLMTETCKLQRQCAKIFFLNVKENVSTSKPVHHDLPSQFPMPATQFTNNQWATALLNPEMSSTRPDGSLIPIPMNFCVKNYVNCSSKPISEIGPHNLPLGASHHKIANGQVNAGLAYRLSRSTTLQSGPEENDETIGLQSFNEGNWPRLPPDSIEEIQRRMSDTRLWEADKAAATELKPNPFAAGAVYGSSAAQHPVADTKVWSGGETRTSLTDEYTGEATMNLATDRNNQSERRFSEPRTAATEEYFRNAEPQRRDGASAASMPNPESNARHESTAERTFITEEYAGQAQPERSSGPDNPFKGAFTFAVSASPGFGANTPPGSVSPRTAVVNDYTGSRPTACPVPYFVAPWSSQATAAGSQQHLAADCQEGRRTSSLDAYVGSIPPPSQEPKARSENNLAALPPRTNLVDQYFQGRRPGVFSGPWLDPTDFLRPVNYQLFPSARQPEPFPPHGRCYESAVDAGPGLPEANGASLDSWTSHVAPPNDRLRASSVGSRSRAPGFADESDTSLLSHTSYPSWASHPCIPANAAAAPVPRAIEQINRDSQNWKQWAPPNSLNYDHA